MTTPMIRSGPVHLREHGRSPFLFCSPIYRSWGTAKIMMFYYYTGLWLRAWGKTPHPMSRECDCECVCVSTPREGADQKRLMGSRDPVWGHGLADSADNLVFLCKQSSSSSPPLTGWSRTPPPPGSPGVRCGGTAQEPEDAEASA